MKAFLLAAGLGTRLRPLTNDLPKCLVPVAGKPLLSWWIELLEENGVDEVLINLHHLPEKVEDFLKKQDTKIRFRIFCEERLLGSAGTLRANREFVCREKEFYILYADNLTNYNLTEFLAFHRRQKSLFSMALFHSENPQACGIAQIDQHNTITSFEEKPKKPKSSLANAGLYISGPAILDMIPDRETADIGFDLLPLLSGKMKGWITDDYLIDIGTLENLRKAGEEWPKIIGARA
ncbi:MAG: nucleotidyltransferase family protein [Candidatus Edwardsbacteria bacterium]|nr:nucleotidyltransferase family protein [Candidatus Edwardsbacteria bacterium]